jgi:MSHA biogenesis protein MshK
VIPVRGMPILMLATVIILAAEHGSALPDPTRPADYFTSTVTRDEQPMVQESINWNLTAIRTSPQGRSAIVNGKLVKVGDEIDSGKVLEITSTSVVLEYSRKQLEINLIPRGINKSRSRTE